MDEASGKKAQSALAPGPAPLAAADRLASIDVLRGLALFGVMAINLVFAFRVSIFEQFLPASEVMSPLDRAVATFLDRAMELKAFALFSLLFGVGLSIQFERLPDDRRILLLLRRMLALLAIGLIHLILVWNGDILTEYALAGLIALPFLFAPGWFLAAGGLLFLILYLAVPPLVPLPDPAWMAHHVSAARHVYATGSFREVILFQVKELPAIAPLHIAVFPRTLALFLFGAFIWRTGVLRDAAKNRNVILGIGLAGLAATVIAEKALANVTLAFAYAAFVIAAMTTGLGSRLLGWAAPLGRMAFTNYLAQSLIFGWVFYGYGFGLFGQLTVSVALAFGVAVYAGQAIFSRWWLSRYRFGPIEWLWRTLMYGAAQPMRLAKATTG